MKNFQVIIVLLIFTACQVNAQKLNEGTAFEKSPDLQITSASVTHHQKLQQLVFEIKVQGKAGNTLPQAIGNTHGAPVLGYVFPTSLNSQDIGFSSTSGTVALALTSHPDFDDTPLWDENNNMNNDDDGIIWHSHWVILVEDNRIAGGLSVKKLDLKDTSIQTPATHPGMPIYLDSPGHAVFTDAGAIRAVVPAFRVNNQVNFQFDAVSAYMQVNTQDPALPMLGVYKVYSVLSSDLSLPYNVARK